MELLTLAFYRQGFEKRLASQHQLWSRAIDATSQLDALMCLAAAALSMEVNMAYHIHSCSTVHSLSLQQATIGVVFDPVTATCAVAKISQSETSI